MKRDEATGMPEVPEGYFWRVIERKTTHTPSEYTLRVVLMQRVAKAFGGTKGIGVSSHLSKPTAEDVYNSAIYVLSQYEYAIRAQESIHDRDKFLGDYPPKRLERD